MIVIPFREVWAMRTAFFSMTSFLRNEIKVMKVDELYMMCWIQFSQLISGFSFQHLCFVSITSGSICKCVFKAPIFSSHLGESYPRAPSHHFQWFNFLILVNDVCWCALLISHGCVLLLFYTLWVSQGIRRTISTYSVCELIFFSS